MTPSTKTITNIINENKLSFLLVIALSLLQAVCEIGLIIFTYYTLAYIQNNSIQNASETFRFGNYILNQMNNLGLESNITLFLSLMVFFGLIQSISTYLERIIVATFLGKSYEKINKEIARIALFGNYEKVNKFRTGSIFNICITTPDIFMSVIKLISETILSIAFIIVYSRVLITLSLKEFGLTILGLTIFALIQKFTQKRVVDRGGITNESKSMIGNAMSEILKGIKYLKANGSEEFITKKLSIASKFYRKNFLKERIIVDITEPLNKFIGIAILVIIVFIFTFSKTSDLLLPSLAIFIVTLQRLIYKAQTISNVNNYFNFYKGKLKIYDEFISKYSSFQKETYKNNNQRSNLINNIKSITFKDVCFKYTNSKSWLIKNINFNFESGDIIGFVGRSGSGKSTMLSLISCILKPTKGNYYINSRNLYKDNNFTQKYIAFVSQDPYLISGTIYENIIWDQKPNLAKALKLFKEIDSINLLGKLKNGLNTRVGEGGVNLSSGQSQLISIARAIYKDSEIFIFDEATNALDKKTEDKIFKKIKEIYTNKIIIIVSHNLNNLEICNKLYLYKNKNFIYKKSLADLIKDY